SLAALARSCGNRWPLARGTLDPDPGRRLTRAPFGPGTPYVRRVRLYQISACLSTEARLLPRLKAVGFRRDDRYDQPTTMDPPGLDRRSGGDRWGAALAARPRLPLPGTVRDR